MKKIYFLIFTILLNSSLLFAQTDAKAKAILDGVSTKVKSFKAITGSFTIKSITSKGKDNGTKTGTISIKGSKYLLKQGKTEVICDGIKTYTYDGSKTITVAGVDEGNKSLTPQKILSGSYDKDFTYKLVATTASYNEIELIPTDSRKNFKKVNIFVDKAKGIITKAKVVDKSNNTLEFSFSNLNTSANVPDATFTFNKSKYPKDVEVLD